MTTLVYGLVVVLTIIHAVAGVHALWLGGIPPC